MRKLSKKEIKKRVLDFARRYNRLPVIDEFNAKNNLPCYLSILKRGGIEKLYKSRLLRGFKRKERIRRQKEFSTEILIRHLKELHERLGRRPRIRDLRKPSLFTFQNYFGSWNKALLAAGISERLVKISPSEIADKYGQLVKKFGRVPTDLEIKKEIGITKGTIIQRFGSLTQFYQAIHLKRILEEATNKKERGT